ncbi:MAG: hypothetical protein LBT89_06935 [Planctomycetaceae bacterium]|jgi:predicted Zn-dependent protease|nr:hypothetical protein [Planctomycetaceae bacterium]
MADIIPYKTIRMSPMEQYDAAMTLRHNGNETEAENALVSLAADVPDFALTYSALAAIYKRAGKLEQAVSNMQKYCQLESEDPFGYSVLSAFCIAAGKHAEAEDALAKASELRFRSQFG